MNKPKSLRTIDNLGRIVIPKDMRKALNINEWDDLEIYLKNDSIEIKKHKDTCLFCGADKKLIEFKEKNICEKCLSELSK